MFEVRVDRDVPGQYGPGNISRKKVNKQRLHLWMGWFQRRYHGRTKPILWQGRSVLSDIIALCGGERPAVWDQRFWLFSGNVVAAMVHHRILPCPQRYLGDIDCCCSSQGAPPGRQTAGGGRYEC